MHYAVLCKHVQYMSTCACEYTCTLANVEKAQDVSSLILVSEPLCVVCMVTINNFNSTIMWTSTTCTCICVFCGDVSTQE